MIHSLCLEISAVSKTLRVKKKKSHQACVQQWYSPINFTQKSILGHQKSIMSSLISMKQQLQQIERFSKYFSHRAMFYYYFPILTPTPSPSKKEEKQHKKIINFIKQNLQCCAGSKVRVTGVYCLSQKLFSYIMTIRIIGGEKPKQT